MKVKFVSQEKRLLAFRLSFYIIEKCERNILYENRDRNNFYLGTLSTIYAWTTYTSYEAPIGVLCRHVKLGDFDR